MTCTRRVAITPDGPTAGLQRTAPVTSTAGDVTVREYLTAGGLRGSGVSDLFPEETR